VDSEAGGHDDRFDGPVTIDLLADLQAGLLDERTAARLRHRARTDPDVARQLSTLERVRRELADLGVDAASAPDIPADVTARVGTALRNQLPPANRVLDRRGSGTVHAARDPVVRFRTTGAVLGLAAVIAAGAVGTVMLLRKDSAEPFGAEPTASSITVSRPSGGVPLSDAELLALLTQPPDLGALASPRRRASCLIGLGYSTGTSVLGARPLEVMGRPGVLVLLPGDVPSRINAVVVAPNCSSVDTGLLASTVVNKT
jgi:hypothetical protein